MKLSISVDGADRRLGATRAARLATIARAAALAAAARARTRARLAGAMEPGATDPAPRAPQSSSASGTGISNR